MARTKHVAKHSIGHRSKGASTSGQKQRKPQRLKIRHFRKTSKLLIPAAHFIRTVREISFRLAPTITRWQAEALVAIQEAAEEYIVQLYDSDDVININLSESTTNDSKSVSDRDIASCHSSEELRSKMVSDDSDLLIDSENSSPSVFLPDSSDSASVSHQSTAPRKEMAEARKKLSLLLATDNPVLLSSNELSEILRLTSLLKTDSTLNPNEHDILKLVDEIPLACKELQETEKTTEEADRFNEDLETNIAWAIILENEYDDSKGYESLLQTELDSNSRKVKKLQEKVDVLTKAAETKKKEVYKLISKQQMVDECLPKILKEIETGKDQMSEWELKKQRAEEKKAKILSKFAPLKGLSL